AETRAHLSAAARGIAPALTLALDALVPGLARRQTFTRVVALEHLGCLWGQGLRGGSRAARLLARVRRLGCCRGLGVAERRTLIALRQRSPDGTRDSDPHRHR